MKPGRKPLGWLLMVSAIAGMLFGEMVATTVVSSLLVNLAAMVMLAAGMVLTFT